MTFKKVFSSENPIIIGDTDATQKKFPPGFSYRLGSIIYTVKTDVTQEESSPMREVILSDGTTEIIPVESIARDLKEPDCDILEPDVRFAPKEAVKKKVKKKKKTKKKNI